MGEDVRAVPDPVCPCRVRVLKPSIEGRHNLNPPRLNLDCHCSLLATSLHLHCAHQRPPLFLFLSSSQGRLIGAVFARGSCCTAGARSLAKHRITPLFGLCPHRTPPQRPIHDPRQHHCRPAPWTRPVHIQSRRWIRTMLSIRAKAAAR